MTDTASASAKLDTATAVLAPEETAVSDQDRARIEQIKNSIDLTSSTSVINFGADSEKQVAEFADTVLDKVMSRDLGPIHEQLSEVKRIATSLNAERLNGGGGFISRLFFNIKSEIGKFSDNFQTARDQIDTISIQLEDQIHDVNLGLVVLDKLFDQNLNNFEELSLHVAAGKELMEHYRSVKLPEMERLAESKKDDPDGLVEAQKVRDLRAAVDRLDRKIMNLEKSRAIAHASMPTIRQVQQTGIMLVEELRSALAHAIPAWKNTMLIYIEQMRQKHGLDTLKAMTDFTNAQLQAMADQLDQNTVAIHEQSARGIADVEVITGTINKLVATLDKVDELERQARESRTQGRAALAQAEQDLRAVSNADRMRSTTIPDSRRCGDGSGGSLRIRGA